MAAQTYTLTPGRINRFKGEILKHAVPVEVLSKTGRQVSMPKNNSDTYVARRWLPYGATATNPTTMNAYFQNGTGDRGTAITQAHLIQEGVTPPPDSTWPGQSAPEVRLVTVSQPPEPVIATDAMFWLIDTW